MSSLESIVNKYDGKEISKAELNRLLKKDIIVDYDYYTLSNHRIVYRLDVTEEGREGKTIEVYIRK